GNVNLPWDAAVLHELRNRVHRGTTHSTNVVRVVPGMHSGSTEGQLTNRTGGLDGGDSGGRVNAETLRLALIGLDRNLLQRLKPRNLFLSFQLTIEVRMSNKVRDGDSV